MTDLHADLVREPNPVTSAPAPVPPNTADPGVPPAGPIPADPASAETPPPPAASRRYDRAIVEGPLRATVWKLAASSPSW